MGKEDPAWQRAALVTIASVALTVLFAGVAAPPLSYVQRSIIVVAGGIQLGAAAVLAVIAWMESDSA